LRVGVISSSGALGSGVERELDVGEAIGVGAFFFLLFKLKGTFQLNFLTVGLFLERQQENSTKMAIECAIENSVRKTS